MEEVILEMTSKRLGTTAVTDSEQRLTGVITDGDLRRKLKEGKDIFALKAIDLMSRNPKVISKDEFAVNALNKMQQLSITQLVVEDNGKVLGFVHLHDLLREGLV